MASWSRRRRWGRHDTLAGAVPEGHFWATPDRSPVSQGRGSPDETVEHFHATVQRRLADNADHLERLANLLWRLADIRLTVSMARVDKRNRPAELQWRLMRLARAVTESAGRPLC